MPALANSPADPASSLRPWRDYREGTRRPYRACPPDFRETYLRMGWDGIADHYNTNWRCICRWIEESGGDELRAERARLSKRPTARWRRSRMATWLEAVARTEAAIPAEPIDESDRRDVLQFFAERGPALFFELWIATGIDRAKLWDIRCDLSSAGLIEVTGLTGDRGRIYAVTAAGMAALGRG